MLLAPSDMVRMPAQCSRLTGLLFLLSMAAMLRPAMASGESDPAQSPTQSPQGQFATAQHYENAEGVPRDYGKALELYCLAASQNHADATYAIAWMFLNGRGVQHNDAIGAGWLRLAAERGQAHALQMLQRLGAIAPAEPSGCPEAPSTAAGAPPLPPAEIAKIVARTASKYRIDPKLVLAVIATESAYQTDAVSPKNAQGLMQLMPETAQRFGVKNVFDPAENIRGGTMYLRWLLAHFRGNTALAIAAYNAGENAVDRHGGVPPYPETVAYLDKVRRLYSAQQHPYDLLALQ